jgi:hypothetical protein
MKNNKLILFFLIAGCLFFTTCKKVEKVMSVKTGIVTNILTNTADVSGDILDLGEGATEYGHCYGTSPNLNISGTKTTFTSPNVGGFTSPLTGLSAATKYYVKAYCARGKVAVYGSEINFTTASADLAVLTTEVISGITKTSAISGGNISGQGGTSVSARGVCWSVATNPTVGNSKTTDGSGTGVFASSITGLTAGTKYYVRAYATNSGGTAYGNEVSFTTTSDTPVAPTVTTANVTSVTSSSAVCGGEVTVEGSSSVTARGVCWGTSPNPTILNSTTSNGSGPGIFVSNLTTLNPGTTYYVRAYATNSAGTSYGSEKSFPTAAVVPALTTVPVTSVTSNTASSGGDITSTGGSSVLTRGVCWSLSTGPTTADNKTNDGPGGLGTFVSSIAGLNPGTKYYLRAYATNSIGVGYGNEYNFTTSSALVPTLTTASITSITTTSAITGGNITGDGGASVTERGVCYGLSPDPTILGGHTSEGIGTGSFVSNLSGLSPGTTYHIRAYATNSAGTAYGNNLTFNTAAVLPSLTTSIVTSITGVSAICGGNITSDGGALVTARGVCWSTIPNPTILNNKTIDADGIGSFVSNIGGLLPGTTYYIRAYATNSVGSAYGLESSFTTIVITPTLTTVSVSSITSATAICGGVITNTGGASITEKGVCWKTSPGPTISDSKTNDGTGSDSYVSSLSGLSSNTTYYVRAYATNSTGTGYGNEVSFSTGCAPPSASTESATGIGTTTATLNGTINANGFSTTITFEYGTTTGYGSTANASPGTLTGSTNSSVIATVTGLIPSTLYHYRVKAVNCGGTIYGLDKTFTTPCSTPTASTGSVTGIGTTAVTLNGTVNANSFSTTVTFEYGLSTSYGTTVTAPQSPVTGSSGVSVNVSISGLITNTLYHYRIVAVNCGGTTYGNDLTFTTLTSLTTTAISNITATTSSSGGNISTGGGATVTARGVCWSINSNPTTGNSYSSNGSGTGSFTGDLSGLISNSVYYVRAYATNAGGTAYGDQQIFTTLASLSTTSITNIVDISATGGGIITAGGGSSISSRGVCWSTSANPTTANSKTIDGTGTGSFASSITGLTRLTLYYVRSYATNGGGTSYGPQISFTTTMCPNSLTYTHVAGLVAPISKTVTYGVVETNLTGQNKCWITKNLGATSQPSSSTDATEAAAGWYWQFNRQQGYKHDGTTCTPSTWLSLIDEDSNWTLANDPCNILLGSGWRIPTQTEWTNAKTNGGLNDYNSAFSSILKLHAAGWIASGIVANRGSIGRYWTITQSTTTYGYCLYFASTTSIISGYMKFQGYPIRCIKD